MKKDILKPKEENLFSLAAELGLMSLVEENTETKEIDSDKEKAKKQKTYSQLT
jgi:hypothetical protein